MKNLFYDQWKQKRLKKIINLFGSDWFQKKEILELGACHGDIGIELMKLGANVSFADAREEHILEIPSKLNFCPDMYVIDQNYPYSIEKDFDLVLHLGVLYHLENWKQDLECALSHSNIMILETSVNPRFGCEEKIYGSVGDEYTDFNSKRAYITQEHVEDHLRSLGCSFFRFDTKELNCDWSWGRKNAMISFVYDWTYEKYKDGMYDDPKGITNKEISSDYYDNVIEKNEITYGIHFKRMWLVIKNS